jgi:hypothetical protein
MKSLMTGVFVWFWMWGGGERGLFAEAGKQQSGDATHKRRTTVERRALEVEGLAALADALLAWRLGRETQREDGEEQERGRRGGVEE